MVLLVAASVAGTVGPAVPVVCKALAVKLQALRTLAIASLRTSVNDWLCFFNLSNRSYRLLFIFYNLNWFWNNIERGVVFCFYFIKDFLGKHGFTHGGDMSPFVGS